jgi:ABC-2 type transport system permease protein
MIGAEWAKQWRRRRTLIVIASTAHFPVVLTVALVATGSGNLERVGDIPLLMVPSRSGLSVPFIALSSTMRFFLPLVVAVVAGEAVAGEAGAGSLRYALARPVSRTRYLASKAAVAGSICLVLVVVLPLAAGVSGLVAFGWHSLTAINGDQGASGSIATFTVWGTLGRLGISTAFVLAGMASVFSFAFLLSTLTTRSFVAVAGGAALSVFSRVLNADYLPGVSLISRYMPNNEIDLWQHLFVRPADTSGMGRFLLLQAGYVVVFSAAAWLAFTRRDVLA